MAGQSVPLFLGWFCIPMSIFRDIWSAFQWPGSSRIGRVFWWGGLKCSLPVGIVRFGFIRISPTLYLCLNTEAKVLCILCLVSHMGAGVLSQITEYGCIVVSVWSYSLSQAMSVTLYRFLGIFYTLVYGTWWWGVVFMSVITVSLILGFSTPWFAL